MTDERQRLSKRYLKKDWSKLTERERLVVDGVLNQLTLSRNTYTAFDDDRTFGDRVADRIAEFGGSWTFIGIFLSILLVWIGVNVYLLAERGETFDPYPFILLNLFLSMVAALQVPVIMMSQNRHSEKDRLDAAHDYEVNLKAELEIVALHEKLDDLRDSKWKELAAMQKEQIDMLNQLLEKDNNTR